MNTLFRFFTAVDAFLWSYAIFILIVLAGLYLTFRSRFYQFRVLEHLPSALKKMMKDSQKESVGVSPFRLFFTTSGGKIGIGNSVAVVTAITVGGPGALFWLWIAAMSGMLIKYAEIYLGMHYRRHNAKQDGYNGSLMFSFSDAFGSHWGRILMKIGGVFLCIYGVEVYQFTILTDTVQKIVPIHRDVIIVGVLLLTLYIAMGGVRRLANFCSTLAPAFLVAYVGMCLWILFCNAGALPGIVTSVFKSAFVGHAPLGGFVGSGVFIAIQKGMARAVYSGDIAIGFDSIIQSESKLQQPQHQARMAIVSTFSDTMICTLTSLVILVTGLWQTGGLQDSEYMQKAMGLYFPYSEYLMEGIILLACLTTIQSYFVVGAKSATFVSRRWGQILFFCYAIVAFIFFAHFDQSQVILVMSLSGGILVLINLSCMLRLRKKVTFSKKMQDDI